MGGVVQVTRGSGATDDAKRAQLHQQYQRELSKYRQQLNVASQGVSYAECGGGLYR